MKTEELQEQPQPEPGPLPELRSPRQITWTRRRLALSRFWSRYRRSPMGVAGLVILLIFGATAILSIFADQSTLSKVAVTEADIAPCTFRELPCPPNANNILGTDADGRSVFWLVVHGARMSLLVGLVASVITMVIGSLVGIVAGFVGRFSDTVLMRMADFLLVIPWLALAIVLASIFGQNIWVVIGIIGFTSWPGAARLIRAQTLSVKEHLYVERSKALGAGSWYVISRHILPNVMPIILANAILVVAIAILSESALSFLGLGDPLRVTWGTIIEEAFSRGATSIGAWWWLLTPSFCIVTVVLGFTMVGYALDEIINPRIRER
ncbi:MAG: ABC transporter permease [Actinomycetota bacterium]